MSLRLLCSIHFHAILLFFIVLLHVKALAVLSIGNETDHQALLAFKTKITDDPANVFRSWNDSFHFCEWEGVTCGRKHRRVTVLDLQSRGLVGSLSPYIGNLSFMRKIVLANNTIGGQIPHEIGRLFRLQELILKNNSLEGEIPANLSYCFNLKFLRVAKNNLSGSIPRELASLSKLESLSFHANNLGGGIPPFIGNLSSLQVLSAAFNFLEGHIPDALGQLKSLKYIGLGGNKLSGLIPPSLYNLSSITAFSLALNELSGSLPADLFLTIPQIQYFQIYGNQFTGSLPLSLSNASELQRLEARENNFTGKLSVNFGGLQHLMALFVSDNNLGSGDADEMDFFQSLLNCSNLYILDLSTNQFKGMLPTVLGNLSTQLKGFGINNNLIFGEIPSGIGNLVNLTILSMSGNKFTGAIPSNIEVSNLVHLVELDLSENKLSGEIPNSLSSCTSLVYLYMEDNFFQGAIPSSLSSSRGIQVMDLSRNNLSGQIPNFLEKLSLTKLNLSFNNFQGEVPTKGVFANASAISVVGNSRLCGGISELKLPKCLTKESKKRKWSLTLTMVISIACVLLAVSTVSYILFYWQKNRRKDNSSGSSFRQSLLRESYQMLLKPTDGFSSSNLIGVGSFGSVYKGILSEEGSIVAIKVLNLQRRGASKSFISECEALKNIRHRNLVKIITSCSSVDFHGNDFKALVYEFMPNGSLENWLHMDLETDNGHVEIRNLSLLQRTNIAIDVACALDYLHHHCPMPVVHCDLKPSNILFDCDMIAHVGDFGLAKFLLELTNPEQKSSIGIRGTIGYTPPEYGLGNEVSTKGDVYSYGILLLEMITGKRPTNSVFEGGLNLHNYAGSALPNRVMEVVDPKLLNNIDEVIGNHNRSPTNRTEECLISMINVGVACSVELPQERWDISKAISELYLVRDILIGARI
uniref:non-specific serine/threonine protein kinase n=1 Tax=Fagus sylvatica TaxID=28930 RepID=A0A2N9GVF4_FAGSY